MCTQRKINFKLILLAVYLNFDLIFWIILSSFCRFRFWWWGGEVLLQGSWLGHCVLWWKPISWWSNENSHGSVQSNEMLFSGKPFYIFSHLFRIKTQKNFWEEILLVIVPYVTQNTIGIIGTKLVIYKISGHVIFIAGESDASSWGYC